MDKMRDLKKEEQTRFVNESKNRERDREFEEAISV